ncbi:MAG: hypothetical protein C5B58_08870 [Acidobacteria bacterium]|nr:MAG: hypothetical protein C5B58_08870 [Acidobacteriota bacterium]
MKAAWGADFGAARNDYIEAKVIVNKYDINDSGKMPKVVAMDLAVQLKSVLDFAHNLTGRIIRRLGWACSYRQTNHRRRNMPSYLIQGSYTPEGVKTIKRFGLRRCLAFVVTALLACTAVGLAISNGTLDTVHRYTGALIIPNVPGFTGFSGGNGNVSCTGTLVSHTVFLTAGHCINVLMVYGIPPSELHVDFDPTNVYTSSNSWLEVASYALMPGFEVTGGVEPDPNDIGVVILAHRVNNITPAQLAPIGFLDNYPRLNTATTSVLGYGLNEQQVFTGNRLITASYVIGLSEAWLKRSDTPGGHCTFDSGGPTLLISGTTEYQIRVHSSATGDTGTAFPVRSCGENNYDTRIDTVAVQSFIQAQIAANP